MTRYSTIAERAEPRRLSVLLLASFGLTILSFVLGTIVTEHRSSAIANAARYILEDALPASEHLTRARTELRHMGVLLDDYTDDGAAGIKDPGTEADLQSARQQVDQELAAYRVEPAGEGGRELSAAVRDANLEMNAAIEGVFHRLAAQQGSAAERSLATEAKPAIDRMDAVLLAARKIDEQAIAKRSQEVVTFDAASRRWAIFLDTISAIFAVTAAFAVVGVVRRYLALQQFRVTELEHFAGRVAHDIRSPLTSAGLAMDFAKKDPHLDERTRSMLDRGNRTLQRVGQLVDGMLVFARAGAPPTRGARTSVHDVLAGVTEDVLPVAKEKGIDLEIDQPKDELVACSAGVLTSLIANLVGNAIKYMGDATTRRVVIHAHDVGPMVRIEVRDTGPGIPSDQRTAIFDPNIRAASATIPGLGLGLATVRRLVEAHGGAAGVDENKGGGSIFWFQLPTVPA